MLKLGLGTGIRLLRPLHRPFGPMRYGEMEGSQAMSKLEEAIEALVLANKALDFEGVLDAYGHVSVRHPERPEQFLLSCSRSPADVEKADILAFGFDAEPISADPRPLYTERYIHAGIYRARPDIHAVVHSHAEDTLPFGIAGIALKPAIHSASNIGHEAPVWDIATTFGDTDLLVRNMQQADDLAVGLGGGTAVLMRGHGFVAVAPTLIELLRLAVNLPKNARVLLKAQALGGRLKYLSDREIDARLFVPGQSKATDYDPNGPGLGRAWDYYRQRLGPTCKCAAKS